VCASKATDAERDRRGDTARLHGDGLRAMAPARKWGVAGNLQLPEATLLDSAETGAPAWMAASTTSGASDFFPVHLMPPLRGRLGAEGRQKGASVITGVGRLVVRL
jgi:hypothetical protein